jgi:hypothetical protein
MMPQSLPPSQDATIAVVAPPMSHGCCPLAPLLLGHPRRQTTMAYGPPPLPEPLSSSFTMSLPDALLPPFSVPIHDSPPLIPLSNVTRGEEDPIHPPLLYFLLIVVFVVAMKSLLCHLCVTITIPLFYAPFCHPHSHHCSHYYCSALTSSRSCPPPMGFFLLSDLPDNYNNNK